MSYPAAQFIALPAATEDARLFVSKDDKAAPHPVLDHDYEIKPCQLEPHEDPARNQAEAEREAQMELQLAS